MPELNAIHITIIAGFSVVGAIVGWVLRSKRAAQQKTVVNAGWQERIYAQRTEHDRLTEQNKTLMEQNSQYWESDRDAKNRAEKLAKTVQMANQKRGQLQIELIEVRGNLEVSLKERDQLQSDISSQTAAAQDAESKDARIRKLEASLESWQGRLPPLVEKFQRRDEEANQLESDLAEARERIIELELVQDSNQTIIESVNDPEELKYGRVASNDAIDDGEAEDVVDDPENSTIEELVAPEEVLEPDDEQTNVDETEEEEEEDKVEDDEGEDKVEGEDDDNRDFDALNDDTITHINDSRDALRAIKGIGPSIEKTLHELGIFRYQQIADMSEYDIDRVAKHLRGFRSRIYRENWIGQARELGDQDPSD